MKNTTIAPTASSLSLVSCHLCHFLSKLPKRNYQSKYKCPRCGATLHRRIPNSISRTWALLIAALILYLPANLLPITTTTYLGDKQVDTIISGVIYFMATGSWHIAIIIFVASVVVPLLKLIILSSLLISVQFNSNWKPLDRYKLYRITEIIGRWSMVDIYVVSILIALVKLGVLATVEVEAGAIYFASVVVLTMFAARSFDSRLIWDRMEKNK